MNKLIKRYAETAILLGLAIAGWYFFIRTPVVFPDLKGPAEITVLPTPAPTLSFADFQHDDNNALALLINDRNSSWLGLASGLKSMGIPFTIVESANAALNHDVIMVYPALTGANTSPEALRAFAEHVRKGGTLLAFSVIGGGMPELFGFENSIELPEFTAIRLSNDPFNNSYANSPAEKFIPLTENTSSEGGLSGISYHNTKHLPIATFNDGSAAITHNFFESDNGTGHAYAIGLELGHFILRATNARFVQLADSYVNEYQPKIDTFLRFLAKVYQQGEDNAILLSPTPQGKALTVLITHDIDFTRSINNIPFYAEMEKSMAVPATYFIQTKYLTDFSD